VYRNRAYVHQFDPRLAEALDDIAQQLRTAANQTKANPQGKPIAPNAPAQLSVSASDGFYTAKIADKEDGKFYVLEHASTSSFQDATTVDLGVAKNWSAQLGSGAKYFRVRATHYTGDYSGYVYHGPSNNPSAVTG
jgi:hypothetical protein